MPDMLSKKASLIENEIGDNKKGKLPNVAIRNQASAENKKVCCRFNLNCFSKLDKINNIYKEKTDKVFYQHSVNTFKAVPRWKELRELGRKGITSPKTNNKIDLTKEEFWQAYFSIANSDGHKKWIRSYWDKKPTLMTMLGMNQFDAIIERKYG